MESVRPRKPRADPRRCSRQPLDRRSARDLGERSFVADSPWVRPDGQDDGSGDDPDSGLLHDRVTGCSHAASAGVVVMMS